MERVYWEQREYTKGRPRKHYHTGWMLWCMGTFSDEIMGEILGPSEARPNFECDKKHFPTFEQAREYLIERAIRNRRRVIKEMLGDIQRLEAMRNPRLEVIRGAGR